MSNVIPVVSRRDANSRRKEEKAEETKGKTSQTPRSFRGIYNVAGELTPKAKLRVIRQKRQQLRRPLSPPTPTQNLMPITTADIVEVVQPKRVRPPTPGPAPEAVEQEFKQEQKVVPQSIPSPVAITRTRVQPRIQPRVEVPIETKTEVASKPRISIPTEEELASRFSPRLSYRVNYQIQRPVRLTREKTREIFIDRKQEPVLLFFQEVPVVSLIQQRFAELVNKITGAQEHTYAPAYRRTIEVGKYTATKDINARKMYTVNDFQWRKKDNYSPGGNIPLVPVPGLPGANVVNYSPESEVVIAPTAKLTLRGKEPKPIIKTTSQVLTYLQSLISESEYWG